MVDPTDLLESVLDVGKPVVETGCRLIESLLGKPFKVAGGMLADQVYAWRWANRIRIANRAQALLETNHVARRVLPPGFLLPLLDHCGDAEEETLQGLWARLLAGAVSDDVAQHPIFIDLLRKMSSSDARLFWRLATAGPEFIAPVKSGRVLLGICAENDVPDRRTGLSLMDLEALDLVTSRRFALRNLNREAVLQTSRLLGGWGVKEPASFEGELFALCVKIDPLGKRLKGALTAADKSGP